MYKEINFKMLNVKSLRDSMTLLLNSMVDAGRRSMCDNFGSSKPSWLSQTERFESFFSQLSENKDACNNFRKKFVIPLYSTNSESFTRKIIGDNDVIQDDFIKIKEDVDLKLRRTPRGLYLHSKEGESLKSLYLPISEAYSNAIDLSAKDKHRNISMPVKILLGLYSCLFFALKEDDEFLVEEESMIAIKNNVEILNEFLQDLDSKDENEDEQDSGPMGMVKNMMKGFNFDKIGEMMKTVTGDEKANKEFNDVFSKMSEGLQQGKAPLDLMNQIITDAEKSLKEESTQEEVSSILDEPKHEENNSVSEVLEEPKHEEVADDLEANTQSNADQLD